jgi:peptidyl-tRNA hydrolase
METLLFSSLHLPRRRLLAGVAAAAVTGAGATVSAQTPKRPAAWDNGTQRKIVYQLNRANEAYREAIFNFLSAM